LTKPKPDLAGLRYAGQIASEIGIPGMAISGITPENVDAVMGTGLRSIAVSSAVIGASDPVAAAKALKDAIVKYRSQG
jgi:thiamine-phosphate pyrophosphorylase